MKKFVKKEWSKILLGLLAGVIVIVFVLRIYDRFYATQPVTVDPAPTAVSVLDLGQEIKNALDLSCRVEPVSEVPISPEASGSVTKVLASEGDSVAEGDILFELENIQQRVSVADARVALEAAKLALKDVQDENDRSSDVSLLMQTKRQQETLIADAYNNFLNTGLQAYPEDDPERARDGGPGVLGNYSCTTEGTYIVDVYPSKSRSGASFKYSGLESGTQTVSSTDFGTPLGACGLELVFPVGFDKNETWVIPVPNTRAAQHESARRRYETAIQNKDIVLNQTEASPERINQLRGRVNQAQLRLQLAVDSLEKTIVRAKIDGVISGFDLDRGDFVGASNPIGSIKTTDNLELVTFVNANEQRFISLDSLVTVSGADTGIKNISQTIDSRTRKLQLVITPPEDLDLVEGLSVPCQVQRRVDTSIRQDGGYNIPLSAVSIIGVDPHVFAINEEGIAVAVPVEVGALLGQDAVVYGLDTGTIIKDARGIRSGDRIRIKNN